MKPRIIINVAVFAVISVMAAAWTLNKLVGLDILQRPYHVSADFTGASGVQPGFEVGYLGVTVGKVSKIELKPGKVTLDLAIDHDATVPRNVTAKIFRRSALGESQVMLEPVPGSGPPTLSGPSGPRMRGGDHIPIARTAPAPDYDELLRNTGRLLSAAKPDSIQTIIHEMAVGLTGRGQSIRAAISATDRLTGTFAHDTATLDALFTDATALTHDLAAHRGQIGRSYDNLAAVSKQMRASRNDIQEILNRGPTLLSQVESLTTASAADLGCVIDSAAPIAGDLHSLNVARLQGQILAAIPHVSGAFRDLMDYQDGKPYIRLAPALGISAPEQAKVYRDTIPRPTAPALPACPGSKQKITYPNAASTISPRALRPPGTTPNADATAAPAAGSSATDPATEHNTATELWALAAGIVAAAIVGAAIGLIPRRRRSTSDQ